MKVHARAQSLAQSPPPSLAREGDRVVLCGDWSLFALRPRLLTIRALLRLHASASRHWDLSGVSRLDAFGALLILRCWEAHEPLHVIMTEQHGNAFERIRSTSRLSVPRPGRDLLYPARWVGLRVIAAAEHVRDFAIMLGLVIMEVLRLFVEPSRIPFKEFSASLYKTGMQAMPISALVGFLIGVVLSYLSALQLRNFGAEALIINILGIGIIRELGPVLVSILVAGRSGSAITAQLGVMRVTEEIDALSAMGVSRHQRLIWPKVLALALAMPLLVAWTSFAALAGGMLCADLLLDIEWEYFVSVLPSVVPIQNLYIGLIKGVAFGIAIALIACHFGLRVKPNTESLSVNTTSSVVTAITTVILIDAVFAMLTRGIGVPVR